MLISWVRYDKEAAKSVIGEMREMIKGLMRTERGKLQRIELISQGKLREPGLDTRVL